jgi:hypothetical protein
MIMLIAIMNLSPGHQLLDCSFSRICSSYDSVTCILFLISINGSWTLIRNKKGSPKGRGLVVSGTSFSVYTEQEDLYTFFKHI